MTRLRMIFRVSVFLIVGLFLHYVLPQHDVVRVTSTEIIRIDFGGLNRLFYAQADSGTTDNPTRDLRLIYTEKRKSFLLGFVPREVEEVMVGVAWWYVRGRTGVSAGDGRGLWAA